MRGRQVFMDSLVALGVTHIFGNPGTTESPLLDSLIDYPQITYICHLHEGLALGSAAYYAQSSGKTAIVNLHVAPGLGNALGMLFSAMRANVPMIVTAGQQDTRLRLSDPVLGHDLVAMAKPVTKWSVQVERADEMALIMRRAFKVAHDPPYGPVFVALPIDVMEQETANAAASAGTLFRAPPADPDGIAALAQILGAAKSPAIVCGDDVARAGACDAMVMLAELVGANVWFEGIRAQNAFPTGHPSARLGLPLEAGQIAKTLDGADVILLAGGPFFEEVWYGGAQTFPAGAKVVQIEESAERLAYNHPLHAGVVGAMGPALTALTDALGERMTGEAKAAAKSRNAALAERKAQETAAFKARVQKAWERTPTPMSRAMAEIRAGTPADAIVVEEAITASLDFAQTFEFEGSGGYFSGRGGGIGQGLAGALGTQIANPGKPVLCISGDGSAMYSIQALWTAAHHDLPIVFVILANREYRILKHNLDAYRVKFDAKSNKPYAQMDLTGPVIGFTEIAGGMGVGATRVTDAAGIRPALEAAFKSGKAHLVEIAIEGKR